ncbi:hypothetical protein JW890_00620 [candidate division WOR-3 bacterium]|nr:hypothetical protein [candidate division WOR-3 bacterium]
MEDFLPMAAFFLTVYGIVKLGTDYQLKRKLIEKSEGSIDLSQLSRNGYSSIILMWAMILISLAAALLLGFLFPVETRGTAITAMMLGMSGFSMIVYYVLSKILDKKKK